METQNWSWWLKLAFIVFFSTIFTNFNLVANAQIQPDKTLGAESSNINNSGVRDIIGGGAIRGSNLLHSFADFNVSAQREVYFTNPGGIQNIISRVTGGKGSEILGTLGVLGNANLFLINPNGILFGSNARLDVRGSFFASTADSVVFDNGWKFSASNPQAPPLLTINVPIGLQFGTNPGNITVQGSVGLQVSPGQTLGLVGGNISLSDSQITALGGNILLGSVTSPGLVSFIPSPTGLSLDYTAVANFGNIDLSGTTSVTASGLGGGAIQVRGGKITLRDRANLVSDTVGNIDGRNIDIQTTQFQLQDLAFLGTTTFGTGAGGGITIRAADSVQLTGTGFDRFRQIYFDAVINGTVNPLSRESVLVAGTAGSGKAGNIIIDTKQLILQNGSGIINPSYSSGAAGNITIKASESMEVSESGLSTPAYNRGNGGNLTIDTLNLTVKNGAVISTSTFGAGNGGNMVVRATDSIILSQSREDSPFGTGLGTNTILATGNAGNLEINTGSLLLEKGAGITSSSGIAARDLVLPSLGHGGNLIINASDSVKVISASTDPPNSRSVIVAGTVGSGDGGDLTINTPQLIIQGGAGIGASTLGAGKGGNVFINAADSVKVTGRLRNGISPSGIVSASGETLITSLFKLDPPTGAAGELSITTGKLIVGDGGTVSVESQGSGRAGTINIVADAIALNNQGSIDATTGSGAGGNINIQSQSILLRGQSRISTNAGSSVGGNITINSDTLAAAENSDITANSTDSRGGNITINTQGIFGTAFRQQQTPESDITAIGKNPQLQGVVQIHVLSIDPTHGLAELPSVPNDPANQIVAGCPAERGARFVVTGRGGLPEDPRQLLRGQVVMQDWRVTITKDNVPILSSQSPIPNPQSPIVEAQGWIVNSEGNVELVANIPQNIPSFRNDQMNCHQLSQTSR